MPGANFANFKSSGLGETKRALGPTRLLGFFLNGVELQFAVDPAIRGNYSAFVAKQWAGPEAHWVKRGSPLGSPWLKVTASSAGADDPDPGNVVDRISLIAYFDSPGPNPGVSRYAGATRIQVVQNFTGWIEGRSIATGNFEGLTDPAAAWFSVVDIVNGNWDGSADGGAAWDFTAATTTGTGWRDVSSAPAF
jgi:hypothetical protein